MDGQDQNRTFRVNFSNDGAAELRERIRDKLKEFMGDYTDDTLVEYVIVLLRNGRHKEEARNELNVFLGDDTDNFVSWLWEHLSSNLHLYVQQEESCPEPVSGQQAAQSDFHQFDSGTEREKSTKESKIRRKRDWKGIVPVAEPALPRSSEMELLQSVEKKQRRPIRVKRSHSPSPPIQNKRSRPGERQFTKREGLSHPAIDAPRRLPTFDAPRRLSTIDAPRRLLQSAVRDAVGTLRTSSARTDPTLKRLRSVVSTSSGDSCLDDQPHRIRSVARLPSAVSTAFKAAAEAAEDVTRARIPSNVFDRLGHGVGASGMTDQLAEFQETMVEDADYEDDFDQTAGDTHSSYLPRNEYSGFDESTMILDRDTGPAYDSASDNDVYDDAKVMRRRVADDVYDDENAMRHGVMDASETGTSYGNKGDDSLMVQYSVADNTDKVVRRTRVKDQKPPANVANTSRKIVNISVNVNTWKPSHYQAPREAREVENVEAVPETDAGASRSAVRMDENTNPVMAVNENEKAGPVMQKESQKTLPSAPSSYSTGRPIEDADSRTIFVNNVHFGATKDTLSRHFNKFGEVLKVVIVTDAATGQPKGSAYIEFMRKEAAELALSLNGTSFMSRILKVVQKSSAYQEASNIMTWPHVARASPFGARFGRGPFLRGMPAAFRSRLPIKAGARSLQWKRDAPTTTLGNESSGNVQNGGPSPSTRSLTYVRKEVNKPDGNANAGPA